MVARPRIWGGVLAAACVLALWAWHIPALFQATLTSEPVHIAQHASFFLTAVLFWWSAM